MYFSPPPTSNLPIRRGLIAPSQTQTFLCCRRWNRDWNSLFFFKRKTGLFSSSSSLLPPPPPPSSSLSLPTNSGDRSGTPETSLRYFEVKLSLANLNYVWSLPQHFILPWGGKDRYLDATSSIPQEYWSGSLSLSLFFRGEEEGGPGCRQVRLRRKKRGGIFRPKMTISLSPSPSSPTF